MKTVLAGLVCALALLASGSVEYIIVPVNGPHHSGPVATKFVIYDSDPGVTGYEIEITVCHPTRHGCISRRLAQVVAVDGAFGQAEAVFDVPPSEIEGEPEITPLPDGALQ